MNWEKIIDDAELVYASVTEDTGFRTWSLKETTCNISFYEEFQIEDIDKIVCSILNSNNKSINIKQFATILGFNVVDNFDIEPKRYADNAELDVFIAIIQPVIDWGLIEKNDDFYILTELGEKALVEEKKYRFYSGKKILFENVNIEPKNSLENQFFPFNLAIGVYSEITNRKKIAYHDIQLEEVFFADETELIKCHKLQSKKEYHIYKSEQTQHFSFGSCQVDIRLFKKNGEYFPIVFYEDSVSTQATALLNNPENTKQKDKKVEWALYLRLIKDPYAKLDYDTIIPFEDLLELDLLINDRRLVWSDYKLFSFIAENVNADQWFAISNNCPVEILKFYIDEYGEKLDWTSLSIRIDDEFLIHNSTSYPWNFEAISAKEDISIEVIKTLLLIPELKEQEWDWDVIMPQLDIEFIKLNIDKVNFELSELTKTNILDVQPLISQYTSKKWDWTFISNEYELDYILENISRFSKYINLISIINRAFTSHIHVQDFCLSSEFQSVLANAKDDKLSNFSSNQSNYIWSETLIDLLENTGYLTWESGNYALGFECNPFFEWSYEMFNKYHSKITTQKGFDFISSHISNNRLITDFNQFNWNWDLISTNINLINDSAFVLQNKDKLNFNLLLSKVDGETLELFFNEANILSFLEQNPEKWLNITEKVTKEFILKHIDFNWNWNILTKRFCSTIRIESLGNAKWIDKWDWNYLTQNLDFNTVIDKLDLYIERWDWNHISQKADKQFILDNLPEYNEYWNWEILLKERIDEEDLNPKKLAEVATCISIFDDKLNYHLWGIITRKFAHDKLKELISYNLEIFHWDYGYFYDLPDFNPREYLRDYHELINWEFFSKSNSLNKSLKHDKSLFSYSVWIKDIFKLLKTKDYDWDFKSLSRLDSINWNDTILKVETKKWDWNYLSEFSGCFKKGNGFDDRFDKFAKHINFQTFSKRLDSDITEKLIEKYIDENWDWGILSNNHSVKFTTTFINKYRQKEWNWQYLSSRNDIEFNNEILIELSDKNWDWQAISKRTDIIFSGELITSLYDKPLDWLLVSKNESFEPNAKVLSILSSKELDWKSISKNPKLSSDTLWDYKNNFDWKLITANDKLVDISNIAFLKKYKDYLDWEYISSSDKFETSIENLQQFKDKLIWNIINDRAGFIITEEMLEPFADVLNWSMVSKSMDINFTEQLLEKYREYWDWQLLRRNPLIIERLETSLKKYQAEFNCVNFLERFNRTPYIYHFTHLFNAVDIIKERKILSRNKADGKFASAAGNLVDRRGTAHNYARFYFRPQTPTQFYNECLGWDMDLVTNFGKSYYSQARNLGLPKCPIPVFFKFDLKEVLMKMPDKCFYSTGNMQTNRARVLKISDNPYALQTNYLYDNISDAFSMAGGPYNYDRQEHISIMGKIKEYSQQEFLIKEEFDFSALNSFEIICYNDEYVNILKSQLGDNPLCRKINANDWSVYHRENRELRISQTESEISIESDYRDSAYLSIKGEGLRELEILETENIQKETETEIIAYPRIRFIKTDKPIEVHFVDTSIGKRDWLIYKN